MSTDKDWEKWGEKDPYYGVLSSEAYRKNALDDAAKNDFFVSGEEHIDRVLLQITQRFGDKFNLRTALDFGCGVGRLIIPLARKTESCLGVDISQSMLEEASKNISSANILNTKLMLSDDEFVASDQQFSLVHSYIVLQHIPWKRGRIIIKQLAKKVESEGVLAAHIFTASKNQKILRGLVLLRYAFPPLNWLRNILKRRPVFEPAMQLHLYDIKTVCDDLRELGFQKPILCKEPDMNGFESVFLLAHRSVSV